VIGSPGPRDGADYRVTVGGDQPPEHRVAATG
jgi:hypothetical protein